MLVRFSVGAIECHRSATATPRMPPEDVFTGVPADGLAQALEWRLDQDGQVPIVSNCLLIRSASKLALVDTCLGGVQSRLRQLTDFGNNLYPFWSPDGEQIAFIHWTDLTFPPSDIFVVEVERQQPACQCHQQPDGERSVVRLASHARPGLSRR